MQESTPLLGSAQCLEYSLNQSNSLAEFIHGRVQVAAQQKDIAPLKTCIGLAQWLLLLLIQRQGLIIMVQRLIQFVISLVCQPPGHFSIGLSHLVSLLLEPN